MNNYPDKIKTLTIISICLYAIIPLLIWKPIVKKINLRYGALKDVMKPMPSEIIVQNKALIHHLKKISPKSSS